MSTKEEISMKTKLKAVEGFKEVELLKKQTNNTVIKFHVNEIMVKD